VRSSLDVGAHAEFDAIMRHVGSRPNPEVPAYTAVDARLGWHVSRQLELSLVAQNLFDARHTEWGTAATRAELERAVFMKLLWRTP
jgi:iron complex outermembrane receptor protein